MDFYGDTPIQNTENHRRVIKFREGKAKQKPKTNQGKFNFRLDKRAWLHYTSKTNEQSND